MSRSENRIASDNTLMWDDYLADELILYRLFAFSALLMTLATSTLVWLYGVVNGKEIRGPQDLGNGSVTKKQRSGNIKGE